MIELVYKHSDFYVVVKPENISFNDEQDHVKADRETAERKEIERKEIERGIGFFNLCCKHFGEVLYPLHRLDKVTSGLMILGRTKEAAQFFQTAFEQKRVEKVYLALSNAKPKKKQGSIVGDMEKSRGSQWKLLKSKQKPAKTRFFSFSLQDEKCTRLRVFLLKPETGKTHQLRVALKSLSAPILGDQLYSAESCDRVYLHAYGLRFDYKDQAFEFYDLPKTGQYFEQHGSQIQTFVEQPFSKKWPSS